jgi:hypothetical protein
MPVISSSIRRKSFSSMSASLLLEFSSAHSPPSSFPPLLPVCLGVATMGGKIGSDTVDPPLHTIDALFKPRLQAIHSLGKHLLPSASRSNLSPRDSSKVPIHRASISSICF